MPDWALGGHLVMSACVRVSAECEWLRLSHFTNACITRRSNGNTCHPKDMSSDWQKIADVVNGWLEPKCWDSDHPFTAQQLATLYTCIQDAAEELNSV